MAGQWIVHRKRQPHGSSLDQQPVALFGGYLDHVQVVAVLPVGAIGRQHHTVAGQVPEAFPVPAGHLAAVGDLAAEMAELTEQNPGLKFVEPAVHAELHGLPTPIPAIEAAAPRRLGIPGPVHHQGAAIAEGSQVLGGVEAEGGEASPVAHRFAPVEGSAGLGAVFNQIQVVLVAEGFQLRQITGLPIKVHGNQGLGSGTGLLQQLAHVIHRDPMGCGGDVGKQRHSSHPKHGSRGGVGGVGRHHHPVTGADPAAPQGQFQGIGAVGNPDHSGGRALLDQPGGESLLKASHPLPQDQLAGRAHALNRIHHKGAVPMEILLGKIERVASSHGGGTF